MNQPGGSNGSEQSVSEGFSLKVLSSVPGYAYLVAAVAALGGLLFGYDIGVISGAEIYLKKSFNLNNTTEELAVSAVLIGSVLGAVIGGRLANAISRKWALFVMAIIYGGGAILTAISPDFVLFFIFRIVVGIAVGASSLVVPMYIAEMAPTKLRGGLTILQQLAITVGILVSYILDYIFATAGLGWRPMFAAAVIPAIILGTGMFFLSYTPRWLALKDRWEEAREVMARVNPERQEQEIQGLRQEIEASRASSPRELFRGGLKYALAAGIGLAVLQQWVGPNTVLFYTPTIFKYAGISQASNALLSTIYVGAALVFFTIPAVVLVDIIGRKALLYIGLTGMAVTLVFLGAMFGLGASQFGILVLIDVIAYIAFYSFSIAPVFWLMSAEVFPNRFRGAGASWSSAFNWAADLSVTISFLTLVSSLGKMHTFWLYALIAVAGLFFVRLIVPETKGRPLENIEGYWRNGRRWPEVEQAG